MVVVSPRWWWCKCRSVGRRWWWPLLSSAVLLARWPWLLDRVVPLLLAYALMPPDDHSAAPAGGCSDGSRVRETKKALLGRSNGGVVGGRYRSSATLQPSSFGAGAPFVAKGTVSKITEKFQGGSPAKATRIPKLLPQQTSVMGGNGRGRSALPPPPLPPLPPPVIKYEIKRRQDKLLGELHRRRGSTTATSFSSGNRRLPTAVVDSAVPSDCGSSSDSEKSTGHVDVPVVTTTVGSLMATAAVDDEKPGSPHSSGYESVEETSAATTPTVAVPYSWVFGASERNVKFVDVFDAVPSSPSSSSSSSSSSSDGSCAEDRTAEDRLERLVTFAPTLASCPALTRAKPDQDDYDDDDDVDGVPVADIRRHFARNGVTMPIAAAALTGYPSPVANPVATVTGALPSGNLSPIPEGSSTEPNSVETVEDCYGTDNSKV